ncbi:FAD-dependent oxidoreductase [Chryseomicrobium palamuruense]|uniref:FAD-dependent oxidoreductase n=1 Tax=Chryseomicrobium palamuruense TaxID=682973 RepID=A0ABV8UWM7_9BACL
MRYVIIGGDAAGMSAAMEIVRNTEKPEITVLEQGHIYSYGQCGLPYVISGEIEKSSDVIARSVEEFRDKYGIDARTGHEVREVDTQAKVVRGQILHSLENFEVAYDKLLVATGAAPIWPAWEGIQLKGIYPLKTIPDTERILTHLKKDVKHVSIIGGGYIGLELAEAFRELDKEVRIFQRGPQLANIFDPDMAELILREAERKNVHVHLEEEVVSFSGDETVRKVHTNKGEYEADLVIVAIGVRPSTQFIKNVEKLENGAIVVNKHMQTSIRDIYAAGDCASHYHLLKETPDYVPLGTTANKQGRIAGLHMIGFNNSFKGILGTSILKFFDLDLGKTGLSEKEVKRMGIDYVTNTRVGHDVAGYYPGKESLYTKLIWEKETQCLLGAQIIGGDGVDKRIDVLAVAISQKMCLGEMLDLDLSYAPPYNGVWDPVQQIAKRNWKLVKADGEHG